MTDFVRQSKENMRILLGLPVGYSLCDVRKYYKKAALLHHPDKGGCEETFKRVLHAYEVLSGREKLEVPDEPDFGTKRGFGSKGQGDFGTRKRKERPPPPPPPPQDIHAKAYYTLEEIAKGVSKIIEVEVSRFKGTKLYRETVCVDVKIRPGEEAGKTFRFDFVGSQTHDGGPKGAVVVTLHYLQHDYFTAGTKGLYLFIGLGKQKPKPRYPVHIKGVLGESIKAHLNGVRGPGNRYFLGDHGLPYPANSTRRMPLYVFFVEKRQEGQQGFDSAHGIDSSRSNPNLADAWL